MYRVYTAILIPIVFLAMGGLALGLWFLLKNKPRNVTNSLFIILGAVFVCLETSKQIYAFCQPGGYNLYSIPLHVCSFFVFFPIFAACLKQEWRITKIFWALSIQSAVIVSIAMLAAPEIIIGLQTEAVLKSTGTYIEYHSVIHHALIVLYLFLAILFRPWTPNISESFGAGCIWGGFLLLAWLMANVLNTDFSSFLRLGNDFLSQLLVWLLHMACFAASTAAIWYAAKWYQKKWAHAPA